MEFVHEKTWLILVNLSTCPQLASGWVEGEKIVMNLQMPHKWCTEMMNKQESFRESTPPKLAIEPPSTNMCKINIVDISTTKECYGHHGERVNLS